MSMVVFLIISTVMHGINSIGLRHESDASPNGNDKIKQKHNIIPTHIIQLLEGKIAVYTVRVFLYH